MFMLKGIYQHQVYSNSVSSMNNPSEIFQIMKNWTGMNEDYHAFWKPKFKY